MSDYSDPLHSVHTVVDEGNAFNARHPELNDTQAGFGALVWGMLRALYECPVCPGKHRVPTKADPNTIVCTNCGGVWVWQDEAGEADEEKRTEMTERISSYTVSPGLGPDAVAVVPPTEDLPVWCQVNVEKWYRELTALQEEILAWRDGLCEFGEPTPHQRTLLERAWQLADGAAIAARRPDGVVQGRTLQYLAEEFAALKARAV